MTFEVMFVLTMDEFESCFLKNFQKSQFTDETDTVSKKAGIQRKCLAQMYNYSLEKLDEQTASHLLEKNLNQYYDTLDKDADKNNIKTILQSVGINQPVDLKLDLDKTSIKTMLKPPACYTDGYNCQKSETVSECDFIEFTKILSNPKKDKSKVFLPQINQKSNEPKVILRSNSEETPRYNHFRTAKDELFIQNSKKNSVQYNQRGPRRTLGMRRNNSKFVPPLLSNENNSEEMKSEEAEVDERLKNIDPKMVELIKNEIMDVGGKINWDDIAGLAFAKTAIQEAVVWPMLRPDIFTGLRRPPKGILLFGPPGTGKTLIGKCVASQSKSTFFSISASSLTSKWVGEGEKMVRALFAVARCHQPAVIFIDEIDSLLSQRGENEHESSRRIKTEFLVQLDGATTDNEERILLIGATNRPQELDEAARRRFVKRLYIPLPDYEARLQLVSKLISKEKSEVSSDELEEVARMSDGYSGADMRNLCSEAALGPIRAIHFSMIENIQADQVRALNMEDFMNAFTRVRSSVSQNDLEQYVVWDKTYGSGL